MTSNYLLQVSRIGKVSHMYTKSPNYYVGQTVLLMNWGILIVQYFALQVKHTIWQLHQVFAISQCLNPISSGFV